MKEVIACQYSVSRKPFLRENIEKHYSGLIFAADQLVSQVFLITKCLLL